MTAATTRPLTLNGDWTVQFAGEHKPVLLAALDATQALEIDLSEVGEMDTAGLQLLLLLKREARQLGKTLQLLAPSEAVLQVLALAGLDGELEPTSRQSFLDQKRGA